LQSKASGLLQGDATSMGKHPMVSKAHTAVTLSECLAVKMKTIQSCEK